LIDFDPIEEVDDGSIYTNMTSNATGVQVSSDLGQPQVLSETEAYFTNKAHYIVNDKIGSYWSDLFDKWQS